MEDELHKWVLARNEKGLRVKDQYIMVMALKVKKRTLSSMIVVDMVGMQAFKASTG